LAVLVRAVDLAVEDLGVELTDSVTADDLAAEDRAEDLADSVLATGSDHPATASAATEKDSVDSGLSVVMDSDSRHLSLLSGHGDSLQGVLTDGRDPRRLAGIESSDPKHVEGKFPCLTH
jgi:hypothetical protein